METALIIMAAGSGTRFKGGVKQLAPIGVNGEVMAEYSLCDAAGAGFDKAVIVTVRRLEAEFSRVAERCEKNYGIKIQLAFQEISDVPEGISYINRKKPWGTAHAVLAARKLIDTSFALINSDDFYGREAYEKVHDFLTGHSGTDNILSCCMAGYKLKNCISETPSNRAVCTSENGMLTSISEIYDIIRSTDGVIEGRYGSGKPVKLSGEDIVSMNMWGFPSNIMGELEKMFSEFLKSDPEGEFLLPDAVEELLENGKATAKILSTDFSPFGITRREDVEYVRKRVSSIV